MSLFRAEIGEQPEVAERLLRSAAPVAAEAAARLRARPPAGVLFAARGSSDHAALYAQYLLGARNRLPVALATPSLFTRYQSPPRLDGWCAVGVSQSGGSPDVVAVLEDARRQGCYTIAITNRPESPLGEAAELVIDLDAGPERSVPASKTYLASLLAVAMISSALDPEPGFAGALERVPEAIRQALAAEPDLDRLVPALSGPRAIVLGRGFNFATAQEAALKLAETSYVLARAWSIADFEHGPIALVEGGFPVLLVGAGGAVDEDLAGIRSRLLERGARVLELTDDSGLPEELTPLPLAVRAQLLAYRVAVAQKIDPDRPRALSKVTRTW